MKREDTINEAQKKGKSAQAILQKRRFIIISKFFNHLFFNHLFTYSLCI